VINAILWKLRTGAPWRDLPDRYGPWKTAHERLRVWTADGTWERILDHVIVKDDSVGNVEWTISIDSSSIRAHQHSARGPEKDIPWVWRSSGGVDETLESAGHGVVSHPGLARRRLLGVGPG
jgi:transposase